MGNIIGKEIELNIKNSFIDIEKVYGNSTQETRSGKNKFVIDIQSQTINGVTLTKNTDGTYNLKGTSTAVTEFITYIEISKLNFVNSQNYTASINASIPEGVKIRDEFYKDKNTWLRNLTVELTNKYPLRTAVANTTDANYIRYMIRIESGTTVDIKNLGIQLEEGTTATEYEQYGASPTPEFPSEIRNIGDNVNLFDKDNIIKNAAIINTTGVINYGSAYSNISNLIRVTPNTKYILSYNYNAISNTNFRACCFFDNNERFISGTLYNPANKITEIIVPSNVSYIRFGYDVNCFDLKFGKDTIYTPYNCGSIDLKVENENLFDNSLTTQTKNGITFTKNSNGTIAAKGTANATIVMLVGYVTLGKGTYIASGCPKNGGNSTYKIRVGVGSAAEGTFLANDLGEGATFTLNETTVVNVTLYIYSGQTVDFVIKPQINKGAEAKPYTEHKEQTIHFPLSEGQLLHEGDYLSKDGIHPVRKTLVLTGDEAWAESPKLGFYIVNFTKYNLATILCTHFIGSNNYDTWTAENHIGFNTSHTLWLRTSQFANVSELRTFLKAQYNAGTAVTIEYELAEEIVIPYTEEQKNIYENLMQNIKPYDGTTYIYSINEIQPELEIKTDKNTSKTDFYISSEGYLVFPEYNKRYLIDLNESTIPFMPETVESTVKIAGRDGDLVLGTTYNPINFSISCYTEQNLTLQEKREEEYFINNFLNSIKNTTKKIGIENDNKFYKVKYSGNMTTTNYPTHLKFNIPLKSSESYAKDLDDKVILGEGNEYSDTVKEVGAEIIVIGPATLPTISLNGYGMEYNADILKENKIVIDTNKSTVTHINSQGTKTNAIKYFNHQFPKIQKGKNELKVLSGIDNDENVVVKWNDLKF